MLHTNPDIVLALRALISFDRRMLFRPKEVLGLKFEPISWGKNLKIDEFLMLVHVTFKTPGHCCWRSF